MEEDPTLRECPECQELVKPAMLPCEAPEICGGKVPELGSTSGEGKLGWINGEETSMGYYFTYGPKWGILGLQTPINDDRINGL